MLQLRLPFRVIFLALTRIHVTARTPTPTCTPTTLTLTPISTRTLIPITTRTLTLSSILTSVPLPLAPIRPRRGIPPHLSLLAG